MFSRTEMLIGSGGADKLRRSTVVVFGLGGVGSYISEALVRCGVGGFVIVDNDVLCSTNINRQIIALQSTIGMDKTEAMRLRMLSINPAAAVTALKVFAAKENLAEIISRKTDYVIDAIDTVTSKLAIIEYCAGLGIPVISCMGTGNKLHPERLMLADIYNTSVCPLAKVMRAELRKRGIRSLKVCYSNEKPLVPNPVVESEGKRQIPGSVSFVPPTAGMLIAGQVVRDILGIE